MKKITQFFIILLSFLTLGAWNTIVLGQKYVGTTWYSATPSNFTIKTIGDKEFDVFPPSTGSITFTYQYKKADLTGWFANFDVKIYCYVNNNYGTAINACSGSKFQTYTPKTVSGLNPDATKVKFDRPAGNTHNMVFSAVTLPMAKHIRLKGGDNGVTTDSKHFGNVTWGKESTAQTVEFRSFLTGNTDLNKQITITSSNPTIFHVGTASNTGNKVYNVGKNAFAYTASSRVSNSLNADDYKFNIYFTPTEAKYYSATITITDGASTATVTVDGTGVKRDVTISTNPTVQAIEYLSTLSTSAISGGVAKDAISMSTTVPGEFFWKNPTQQVQETAGEHSYTMTFKPTANTKYNDKDFAQTLTIIRKNQTLTMNDGTVKVAVDGIDAGKADSKIDLDNLIASQTTDPISANRAGVVTYEVISGNKANATIGAGNVFSATVCDTYTIRATKAKTDYYNEVTDEFTVTVTKRANTMVATTNYTRYVDDVINSVATVVNSDGTIHTSSDFPTIAYYDVANNKIVIPNSESDYQMFGEQKIVTIKIWQDATERFEASGEKTITLTVKKYDNNISITGFDDEPQHKIKIEWYDNELVMTTANADTVNYPILFEQITGDDTMASLGRNPSIPGTWVVYTDRTPGLVEWRLWQEETYKYKRAETTLAVNVVMNTNCSCNLVEMSWTDDLLNNPPTVSTVGPNEDGLIDFGGIGEYLYFSLRKKLDGDDMNYSLFTDGNWEGKVHKWAESGGYTSFVVTLGEGEHHTTKVQFSKGHTNDWWIGGDTDDPFINNISVTRKRWMTYHANKTDKNKITALPKQERIQGTSATSYTFWVNFSTCSQWVKVASLDDHVTFDNDMTRKEISTDPTANNTRGYNDTVPVTIKYYSENVEKKDVQIVVYTDCVSDTLIVPVETVGYIFKGTTDTVWTKAENWNVLEVPNEKHDVTIEAPTVVETEVAVNSMKITTGAVTIMPTGGLTVGAGGIIGATTDNLILKAGTAEDGDLKGQTGYLRISPESAEPMPEATIELYSIGYYDRANATDDTNTAAWQCLGAPIEDAHVLAKSVYTQSWVYSWDESGNEWVNNRKNLEFEPFKGFETTQYKSVGGVLLTYAGQLVSGKEPRTIPLAVSAEEKGYNLLANSYTAPMVISQFQNTDFVNAESTIYILNAGTKDQSDNPDASKDAAGKFIGVPINLSPEALADAGYPTIVPSMQGFWVKAKKPGETAQLTLDYSRLVWNQTYEDAKATKPLRAPKSQDVTEDPISGTLKVAIQANGWIDYIYLLESENFDTAYENGYDAHRIPSGDMDIFTIENNDYLGLDATNSIAGTRVGVRTGEEMTYTMTFSHINSEENWMLWDKEASFKMLLSEDVEYTFNAAPNSEITERFQIIAADIPAIATGVDEVESEVHIQKFIKDNQLYILKDGVLYNASGAVVRK